jgi:O-antigen/teichoic acid export membrane protein
LAITFSGQSLAWIAFTYFLNNSLFNLFYCRKITQELQNNKFTPNLKRQSFSLSITEMSNLAFGRIDILLLGTLMPIEQVAIYGLVMKSGAIFTKAARNVMQIFLPKIIKDNQIKLGKFSGIFVFSLIAPFAIIPIFHIFIPFFYGPNFQEVVSFSSIYIFILPISFVYLISGFFLLKYDLDKQNNFNRIIGMTGVIVAYLILIPKLGILGGIIGSFIYYGTISILNLISISKYLKNKVS